MKKERTLEEVQKEYNQLCFEVGHLNAQLKSIEMDTNKKKDDLRIKMDRMTQVILEGTRLQNLKGETKNEASEGSTDTNTTGTTSEGTAEVA